MYPLQVDTSLNTANAGLDTVVISAARLTASPVNYVLQDVQGSTRALMSATSVIARHDFLPFGEELGAGTGMRTSGQGFGATDKIRQRYAMTERDDSTGLDHTWWRKYENRSGRWTSPDPFLGSMTVVDPQSFNRYAYVQNDPVNFVDPSGLDDDDIYIISIWIWDHMRGGGGGGENEFHGANPWADALPKRLWRPEKPSSGVTNLVNTTFSNRDCLEFMSTLLNNASTKKNPVLEKGDIQKIFANFLAQKKGGISRQRLTKYGSASGTIGTNGKGNGTLYLPLYSDPTANQDWLDAGGIVNELPHIAGSKGGWPSHEEFDDFALAQAVHNSKYDASSSFKGTSNPFTAGVKDRYDPRWSNYFHDILRKNCIVPH